ncbi:MAG: peptidylprolyl isomerase [Terrimonas sp.]|nr:peptidylprolyl isomerase [Terrimonas sp.]
MSVIQDIREKYAKWAVVAIALSLIGFILMDAFAGKGSIFGNSNSTTLGSVNGKKIDFRAFDEKVKATEQQQQQQGAQLDEARKQQLIQQLWNQEVNQMIMQDEFAKLGLKVGKKELNDLIYNNPGQQVIQQFSDPNTGQFNIAAYQQEITRLKNSKVEQEKRAFADFLNGLEYNRMMEKFNALVGASAYFPKWYLEKMNTEKSGLASISFVRVPYTTIADSTTQVSDKEIADYISKNKDDFKRNESRSIQYVTFNAAPTAGDSANIRKQLEDLKQPFEETKDNEAFVASNFSDLGYYNGMMSKNAIQAGIYNDSVIKVGKGKVYGPFVFGNNYELAKLVDQAVWPDTVKVRHILIATTQRNQQGQVYPVREDSTAKKLADSIQNVIAKGSNFDSLCIKFSDDPGSKEKGGIYDNVTPGQMVPEFSNFIFANPVGKKGIVKTSYGYHYIEILSQKGSSPVYQVAYLTKPIVASKETDNTASNAANKFAGDSRDLKAFSENWEKELKPKGEQKIPATVGPNDYSIPGLGVSRSFVRDIYKADKGEVLQPTLIGDKYVVAIVTDIVKEGTMGPEEARLMVEPVLRNEKKAKQIIKNIGTFSTLEEASQKAGFPVEKQDSLRFTGGASQLSYETKLVGMAFNPANTGKLVQKPIDGTQGVYVLKVDNLTATAVEAADIEAQRLNLRMQARQRIAGGYGNYGYGMQEAAPSAVLRNVATVKDKRSDFY